MENKAIEKYKKLINKYQISSDIDYVKAMYELILYRTIDEDALIYWQDKINKNEFNNFIFLNGLFSSIEYKMNVSNFNILVHLARKKWCGLINKFDFIFDIGGSSPNIAEGALVELGYNYRPKELIIFDLPEEEQYWGKPKFSQDKEYCFKTNEGEQWTLRYEHGHIEDIENYSILNNKKFDLIFMGQVIEHIIPEKLPLVLKWIRNHLKKDGRFIFDTPNRLITKLLNANTYIDKDHKYEYTPNEIKKLLSKAGLKVIDHFGLLPMKYSYKNKIFDPLEVNESNLLSKETNKSYLFAFECKAKL